MYKKKQKIQKSNTELSNYIEGFDVYNSLFLKRISSSTLTRETYIVTVNEFRPDLIALDFYGDSNYMGILLAQIKIGLEQLKRGTILELLPKDTIDYIISNM